MDIKSIEGWSDIDKLHSYIVCKSPYFTYSWVGKLLDIDGKPINILGMVQDEVGISLDKKHTENVTKKEFEYWMSKKDSANGWVYIKARESDRYISFSTAEETYGVHLTSKKDDACTFTTVDFAIEFLEANGLEHDDYIIY